MIPQKTLIRGAFGLWDGIGIEEIEIDWTKFNPGIIVINGRTGSGKTTLLENMQPYPKMVTRDGKLADEFFLKNSVRENEFTVNGKRYKSTILIDALTKGVNYYLTEDGVPLCDGKKSTYLEVVEKILGSENIFFNTAFRGQKMTGIASMKDGQLRELFYEALGLSYYSEKLLPVIKEQIELVKMQCAELEGKISGLATGGEISMLQAAVDEITEQLNKMEAAKATTESSIQHTRSEIIHLTAELAKAEEIEKQNAAIAEKISEIEKRLTASEKDYFQKKKALAIEIDELQEKIHGDQAVAARQNDAEKNIEYMKLLTEKKARYLEASKLLDEIKLLNAEIKEYETRILKKQQVTNEQIERYQKILNNREKIDESLYLLQKYTDEKAEITERISDTSNNINAVQRKQIELQETQQKRRDVVAHYTGLLKGFDADITSLQKEINQVQQNSKIIGDTPCDDLTGKSCQFLQNAYAAQSSLSVLEEKLKDVARKREAEEIELQAYETTYKDADLELTGNLLAEELHGLKEKLSELQTRLKEVSLELTSLNKFDWKALEKEADKAESEIAKLKEQFETEEKYIKELMAKALDKKDVAIQQFHTLDVDQENVKSILEATISTLEVLEKTNWPEVLAESIRANLRLVRYHEQRVAKVNEMEATTSDFQEKKSELEAELRALAGKLQNCRTGIRDEVADQQNKLLKLEQKELAAIVAEIDITKQELLKRESELATLRENSRRIEVARQELAKKENDLLEWNFLLGAFSDTGIPCLELENAAPEITREANELLETFEANFQIRIETVQLKADKKSYKNVFAIQIVGKDRTSDSEKKSGGQKIWIDTAIEGALLIFHCRKNKAIQTVFYDEKDNGFDSESAFQFIEVMNKVRERAGLHYIFLITHRNEIQRLITQQVKLLPGKIVLEVE